MIDAKLEAPRRSTRLAAASAAVGFLLVAAFQAALALGAPFGEAAWGGGNQGRLPAGLRIASAGAVAFWVLAASVMLGRAGAPVGVPRSVLRRGPPALTILLLIGAAMNMASSSVWERAIWAPWSLVLALATGLVWRARDSAATGDRLER